MFSIHKNNIHGIKAAVDHYGTIWFHGDGNMYHKEYESDTRKIFSNPLSDNTAGPGTYRVKFTKGDAIPETVEALKKLLLDSKNKDYEDAAKPKSDSNVSTFKVAIPVETEAEKVAVSNVANDDRLAEEARLAAEQKAFEEELAKEEAEKTKAKK